MTATAMATLALADEVAALTDGVPGWSPPDELFALSLLAHATAHLTGDVVEVGSWCGRSAVALGAGVRGTHGRVHCIDLFPTRDDWRRNEDGSYSFCVTLGRVAYQGYQEQTVWAGPFEQQLKPLYDECPDIRARFDAAVQRARLGDLVIPHRGTSTTFAAAAPPAFQARLLFIDGDHSYSSVVRDIESLEPFLVPGGWICFDDAFSSYPGVDRAITERIFGNPSYDITRQMTRKCFVARRTPHEAR